jgi:prophage regulatory protein
VSPARFDQPPSLPSTSARPGADVAASVPASLSASVLDTPAPAAIPAGRPTVAEERFLRVRDVCAMVGLSASQVYALVREDRFPAAFRLGPNYSRWLASEVRAWMRTRLAQATRARGGVA